MSFDVKSLWGNGASSGATVNTISGPSAVQFFGDADSVFVDVRGHDEIKGSGGTVKGATIAPLPEFASRAKADGTGALPAADAGKRIILVCASGARSNAAATQLIKLGYANVANLKGGISSWVQAGGAMQK